ncbi:MAG: hypothetical protein GF310_10450 [candidate division Zixibacteria bacterium]|nr:hypothetical protein [candidate division Zixibacteria bacterium]
MGSKRIAVCLVILITIFCLPALAPAATVIDHLPYHIHDVSNRNYILEGNLSSSTNGIRIGDNVHDIVLNLNGKTLTFGTGGGDDNYGIAFYWNAYDVEIKNGSVLHAPGYNADNAYDNNCIFIGNSHDLLLNNINATIDGVDGKCVKNNGTTYNLEISGGTYKSNSTAFTSRCNTTGAVIWFLAQKQLYLEDDYHLKIHDISISNGPHTGISINKSDPRCLAFIHDNYITTDAVNELYPESDGNTCHSSGNAYGISIYGLQGGSKIYNNIIRSGSSREGSQGILLQDCKGTAEKPVEIYGNDILVSSGPTFIHSEGKVSALYWRYVPGESGTGNRYNHIYDNIFKVKVDTYSSTSHIGSQAEAVSIFFYGNTSDNIFEKNHVEVIPGSSSGFMEVAAIGFGIEDTTMQGSENIKNNIFRYNHYKAPRNPVAFGNSRGVPGNNIVLYKDTIDCSHTGPDSTTIVFDVTGAYRDHSTGNRLRNCVFLNQASDDDVVFSFQAYSDMDSLGQDVTFERNMNVWVKGYNNKPVTNAEVFVINNYGDTVLTGATNQGGLIGGVVTYKYLCKDPVPNDDVILKDSLGFNNFHIIAKKQSDNNDKYCSINCTMAADTVALWNTYGDGIWGAGGDDACAIPPTMPTSVYPINGARAGLKPTFIVNNSNPGECDNGLIYHFRIASDPDMENIIGESGPVSEESFRTSYTYPAYLQSEATYTWQARSYNGSVYSAWTEPESFIASPAGCGDVNNDDNINVSDIIYLINYIFNGGDAPNPFEIGDVNCNGSINVTDVVYMTNYIFMQGPAPCDPNLDGQPDC